MTSLAEVMIVSLPARRL